VPAVDQVERAVGDDLFHAFIITFFEPFSNIVKGRAFGSPLARDLYPRASTAEVDPRSWQGRRILRVNSDRTCHDSSFGLDGSYRCA
jgi:hypothetical protein